MNRQKAAQLTVNSVGAFAVGLGLLLGSSLVMPLGEAGNQGLYRWTNNGETKVVYSTNDTYYVISTRVVTAASVGSLLLGVGLLSLGRRFRSIAPHA
jgi:hypothetical protein